MFNMTEPPVREVHVAWKVSKQGEFYRLTEVVRAYYRHPDAPDIAEVRNLELRDRGTVKESDLYVSPLIVHFHADKTVGSTSASLKR